MSTVAATPASTKIGDLNKPRLWLYGGATHPYNIDDTSDELLWTEEGGVWIGPQDRLTVKLPGKEGKPLGATLLYGSDRRLHLLGRFRSSRGDLSMSVHTLEDVGFENPSWVKATLEDPGWDFPSTDLFLIRSVSFRERRIFWPVFQVMTGMERYSARIYNTP
jgi:hypothetical protein